MGIGINIKKVENKTTKLKIRNIFKRDKYGFPNIKENKIWAVDNYNYYYTDFDILYDLIKADLVEKVEDK